MVGGNPQHDAYGFRNWKHGAFAEYRTQGSLGKFEGFCAALWSASFCVVGPEYISMVAAEAKRPRTYIKAAFKTVYWRFGIFFIGGALAAGIVVAHNDPELVAIVSGTGEGGGTAAASPYVIAMKNMGIVGLPHFVNALLVTSIFSAGNTYTYCATRSLYGMAVEGRAPGIFRKTTKNGVPIFCFFFVMLFPCLSFLQISSGSNKVLTWLVNLITAGGIINYITMTVTYIFFWRAMKAQGVDRKLLPYCGWFQPWSAYIGLAWMIMIVTCYGYTSFAPWSVDNFFIYYTMVKKTEASRDRSKANFCIDFPRNCHLQFLEGFQEDEASEACDHRLGLGAPGHRCIRGYLPRATKQLLARNCWSSHEEQGK
jgi:amino acid transporter